MRSHKTSKHGLVDNATALVFCVAPLVVSAVASAQSCPFESPVSYPAGTGSPSHIASGDLDGDGDLDLVVDSNTGFPNDPLRVHLNNGDGTYSLGAEFFTGDGPGEISLGDMDGDGDLDLIKANYFSNDAYFFRNNGNATFESPVGYATGGGNSNIVFMDIDGDGDLDFVATDHFGGRIRPYRNINGLGFTSVGLFEAGANPLAIATGDLDGDGDEDVVVTNEESGTFTVAYNSGTGTFPTRATFTAGDTPWGVALADLDADGALDAAIANWGDDSISVLFGDGLGGFSPAVAYSAYAKPTDVRAGDFNGDGVIDLVATAHADNGVSLFIGAGDGTFEDAELIDAGADPWRMSLGDFDGDGDTDIATVSRSFAQVSIVGNTCDDDPGLPPIEVLWQATADNEFLAELPAFVAADPNGGAFIAGDTYFTPTRGDYYVARFSDAGDLLWQTSYDGVAGRSDHIDAMVVDSQGSVIVTGESWNNDSGVQWVTAKFASDGSLSWAEEYTAANTFSQQRPAAIAVGPGDRVAVCGYYIGADFDARFAVVVYTSGGTQVFATNVADGAFGGQAYDLAFTPDGGVVATGVIDDDDEFGEELFVAKLSPGGDVLWTARYDGTSDDIFNETVGRAVLTDAEGNVYAAGYTRNEGGDGNDFVLVKHAADGAPLWDRRTGAANASVAYKLTEGADGTIYVSGTGPGSASVLAFSPDGQQLWATPVPAIISTSNPKGHLALGADGILYLLGQLGSDFGVFQISPDGELLSETRLDSGETSDNARAIAAAPDGPLYAVGWFESDVTFSRDALLFKFRPAGGETPCPADWTGDGVVNAADVGAFLSTYFEDLANGTTNADFDGNGVTNAGDVGAFLTSYFETLGACP